MKMAESFKTLNVWTSALPHAVTTATPLGYAEVQLPCANDSVGAAFWNFVSGSQRFHTVSPFPRLTAPAFVPNPPT